MTMLYLMLYWYFSRISIHLFLKCLYPSKQQKKELLIRYAEGKFNSFQIIWELCAPLQLWRINPAQKITSPGFSVKMELLEIILECTHSSMGVVIYVQTVHTPRSFQESICYRLQDHILYF